MHLKIHRGTHEIGGICIELATDKTRIIIDIGQPLVIPETEKSGKTSDSDLKKYLPEISGAYSWDDTTDKINALLITHAHQDHYGFIEFINPEIPVICGIVATELIKFTVKFKNKDLSGLKFISAVNNRPISIGDFKITPFLMDHSAYDSYGYLIEAENKKIYYTGDFRDHGRKKGLLEKLLKQLPKLDLLLVEGTNVSNLDRPVKTEDEIEKEILEVCNKTSGTVFCHTSSQNIDRIVSLYKAAKGSGRALLIDLYTAMVLELIHKHNNKIPDILSKDFENLKLIYTNRLDNYLVEHFGVYETLYKFNNFRVKSEFLASSEKKLILVRPSILGDLNGITKSLKIDLFEKSTLIYSQWRGYLELPNVKRFVDFFKNLGAEIKFLHTSGHASQQLIRQVIQKLDPETIIPVHTNFPENFKEFSSKIKILEDKKIFNF